VRRFFSFAFAARKADVGSFTRELADLLDADVPLLRALILVKEQAGREGLARILGRVVGDVEKGESLAGALGRHGAVFSNVYVGLVRAGETSGNLASALGRLAEYLEGEHELRAKVATAVAYPALIAAVGFGTVVFLLTSVVPRLADFFVDAEQELPLVTRLLLEVSVGVSRFGWVVALVLLMGVAAMARGGLGKGTDAWVAHVAAKIPWLGTALRKVAVARFARTLSMLLAAGVPIVEALRHVEGTIGDLGLRARLSTVARLVRGGAGLAESFRRFPEFPPFLCHMVTVGEEGNSVERSLEKVTAVYEREADRAMKLLTSLLEPLLILTVGSVVGLIVTAMLLPIFQVPAFVK